MRSRQAAIRTQPVQALQGAVKDRQGPASIRFEWKRLRKDQLCRRGADAAEVASRLAPRPAQPCPALHCQYAERDHDFGHCRAR